MEFPETPFKFSHGVEENVSVWGDDLPSETDRRQTASGSRIWMRDPDGPGHSILFDVDVGGRFVRVHLIFEALYGESGFNFCILFPSSLGKKTFQTLENGDGLQQMVPHFGGHHSS